MDYWPYWNVIPQLWTRHREEQWRVAAQAQIMLNRTAPPPPYYRELLTLAASLVTEGRLELAVIVAQMACEVIVEQTLTPLLKRTRARQTFNIHAEKALKLYKKHSHDQIDRAPFWASYGTHAIRRHEVVHRGRRVDAAEARESLTTATAFVDYVENVGNRLAGVSAPAA